jgi:hypothetical protein
MNDLGIEELKQMINFYKQKSSDLEFTLLQTQIKLNKIISLQSNEESIPATKTIIDRKTKTSL